MFLVIIPSWAITEHLTRHTIIQNEKIYFETHTASGALMMYRKQDSKVFLRSDELKHELAQIAQNRFSNIAEQVLSISNIEYDICNRTKTFLAVGSGSVGYVGNTNSLEILLASDRKNKEGSGTYLLPVDQRNAECRSFGKITENGIDVLSFPHSKFPYYGKEHTKGYVVVHVELVAHPYWRITIAMLSFMFVGNFWITILAVIRFMKKGLNE